MQCRHCRKCKCNRPRGLCWTCYYTPGIRDLYPSTSKYARRGVGNFNGDAPLPELPTDAMPGSEAKIRELTERASRHESLFHPLDSIVIAPDRIEEDSVPTAESAYRELLELRDAG